MSAISRSRTVRFEAPGQHSGRSLRMSRHGRVPPIVDTPYLGRPGRCLLSPLSIRPGKPEATERRGKRLAANAVNAIFTNLIYVLRGNKMETEHDSFSRHAGRQPCLSLVGSIMVERPRQAGKDCRNRSNAYVLARGLCSEPRESHLAYCEAGRRGRD